MVKLTPAFFDGFTQAPVQAPTAPSATQTVSLDRLMEIAASVPPGKLLRVIADRKYIGTGLAFDIMTAAPSLNLVEAHQVEAQPMAATMLLSRDRSLLMVVYTVDVLPVLPQAILDRTIEVRVH